MSNKLNMINWIQSVGQGQGYSGAGENSILALEELGIDVRLMGFSNVPKKNLTKKGLEIKKKPFVMAQVGVTFGFPNAFSSMNNPIKIGYTEWETDKFPSIPCDWAGPEGNAVKIINNLDMLWVACNHNKRLFERAGVKIPIEVVPHGVNPEQYPLIIRPKRKTFTFLMLGTLTSRKDPGRVLSAFIDLFKDNMDVRMVFKTQSGVMGHIELPYKNVDIIDRSATMEEMEGYYRNADCFVFPSRGEGFGLPPVEAMATGLPTIFTETTGMNDYADERYNYPVSVARKEKVSRYPRRWGDVGNWDICDFEDLKRKMKYVVEHREEAYKKGIEASKWVHKNWTFKNSAEKMIKLIEGLIENRR